MVKYANRYKKKRFRNIIRKIFIAFYKVKVSISDKVEFLPGSDISRSCKFGEHVVIGGKVLSSTLAGNNLILGNVNDSTIGYGTAIVENSNLSFVKIGNYSGIAKNVNMVRGNHPTHYVSTNLCFYSPDCYTGFTYVDDYKFDREYKWYNEEEKIAIDIGSDVWIGNNSLLMEGIKIGDGAVVAAGSVVTKDVEPYAVVGGAPAKLIKYRFDEETRKKLLEYKWWDKDPKWIEEHAQLFTDTEKFVEMMDKA